MFLGPCSKILIVAGDLSLQEARGRGRRLGFFASEHLDSIASAESSLNDGSAVPACCCGLAVTLPACLTCVWHNTTVSCR